MDIPNINTRNIQILDFGIRDIGVESSVINIPPVEFYSPPVTIDLGTPIVEMPGCVEAHETNNPLNEQITADDPRGNLTYCDGSLPSFNPPNYEPLQIVPTPVPQVDTRVDEPDVPEAPVIPEVAPPSTATINCPTPVQEAQEPVGTYLNGYRERVTEYKLIDGVCVQFTESVGIPEQIVSGLPSGGQVTQVASIAVVATSAALLAKPLADILLKVVKPTVKKVMKKIAKIRGKQLKTLSVRERQEEQRDRNHAIAKLKSVKAKVKK